MRISGTKNIYYPTIIINSYNIRNNIKVIKELSKKDIIVVLKSNAYGLNFNVIFDIIKDLVKKIAINNLREFFEYKVYEKVKDRVKVLLLFPEYNEYLISQSLEFKDILNFSIFSYEYFLFLREILLKRKVVLDVELEIDSGMNRTGIKYYEIDKIKEVLEFPFFNIKGVYTHLSGDGLERISFQLNNFKYFLDSVGNLPKCDIHILNSGGFLRLCQINNQLKNEINNNGFVLVDNSKSVNSKDFKNFLDVIDLSTSLRIGILIYGISPNYDLMELKNELNIRNSIKVKIPFIGVKKVLKGERVGYINEFINNFVNEDKLIALLFMGYSLFPFVNRLLFKVYDDEGSYITSSIGPMSMDITQIFIRKENLKEVYLIDDELTIEEQANGKVPVYNYLTGLNNGNKIDLIVE